MILQNLDLVKDLDCRQRLDSSIGRPCCCHECILALLLKCERSSLKKATGWGHMLLYIPFSTDVFPEEKAANFIDINALCQLWNQVLITSWRQHPCFSKGISNFDSSDHRTVFHFTSAHFKWALTQRRLQSKGLATWDGSKYPCTLRVKLVMHYMDKSIKSHLLIIVFSGSVC